MLTGITLPHALLSNFRRCTPKHVRSSVAGHIVLKDRKFGVNQWPWALSSGTCIWPSCDQYSRWKTVCEVYALLVEFTQFACRYRFRLISISCEPNYIFSIDGHNMTIIEVDGINSRPLLVDSIQIYAGMFLDLLNVCFAESFVQLNAIRS